MPVFYFILHGNAFIFTEIQSIHLVEYRKESVLKTVISKELYIFITFFWYRLSHVSGRENVWQHHLKIFKIKYKSKDWHISGLKDVRFVRPTKCGKTPNQAPKREC